MIGVIDYGAGNLKSVCNSLSTMNAKAKLVKSPKDLSEVTSIIFPGVGSFGDSAHHLEEQKLSNPLKNWITEDRPFLGICIGFQMLFETSDESPEAMGLGIFPGKVVRFNQNQSLKIPHMGWNKIIIKQKSDPIWEGLDGDPHFYFVHSFYPKPDEDKIIASTTPYGCKFTSSVRRGNLFATQFHPEKSQGAGLRLIRNFLSLNSEI
ncbi:imidazole glycerol phosphate synthase subunit HisH [Verrucomicrobia bacterium]|jgi:imidazole glycerol phosphate synthase glutamine amidotransferase subunit|nr:imidazole glycerol phosphate synthase subunit HisH [Verrucomicrobiota bacterium]|tara:strand:+ start:2891 stop:3511 length:621 start_codon:yes stop_codon:yes gene_type:complete